MEVCDLFNPPSPEPDISQELVNRENGIGERILSIENRARQPTKGALGKSEYVMLGVLSRHR